MGLRLQAVQAVAAEPVGGDGCAVLEEQAHASNAGLIDIAFAVRVAVGINVADQEAAIPEHPRQHLHGGAAFVAQFGQRAGAGRLRQVDAVALQGAGADPEPVAEREQRAVVDRADVEHQCRAGAAFGLGQGRVVEAGRRTARIEQAGAATQVSEAGRQAVGDADAAEQLAGDVLDLDLVVDELAELDGLARGGLLDEEAGARIGVERDVEVHRLAQRGDGEGVAIRTRIDHPLGRQQARGQDRRKGVRARRHHVQAVDAGGHQREAVLAVGAGRQHAGCRRQRVGQEDAGQRAGVPAIAGAGDVEQAHHHTGDGRIGLAVEGGAEGVDQQTRLQLRRTAAGDGHRQAVVRLHAQPAVAAHQRRTQGIDGGHERLDVEIAGVRAGFGRDEGLDVAGQARRHGDHLGLGAQRVEVAARRVEAHVERLAGRQCGDRPGVLRVGEQAQRRRLIGHDHAHRVRIDRHRLRKQAVREQQPAERRHRPGGVRVDPHIEAARQRLAGRQLGREAERQRIDLPQVGRRTAAVAVFRLALQVVQQQRSAGRTGSHQCGVRRDQRAHQQQAHRAAIDQHRQPAGVAVPGVAGGQCEGDDFGHLGAGVRGRLEQLQQRAFGHRDAVDVRAGGALQHAARTEVCARNLTVGHAVGDAADEHEISKLAARQRAEGGAVVERRLARVGHAVAVAVPHQVQAQQVEIVVAAVREAQHIGAARVAGVGEPVRQGGDATGRAQHAVVAGQRERFEGLDRDADGVRIQARIEAAVGVEVGRPGGVVEPAASRRRGLGRTGEGCQPGQPRQPGQRPAGPGPGAPRQPGRSAQGHHAASLAAGLVASYGLIRTPKLTTAEAPAASVPTLALTVPVLPAAGAVTLPWLVVAATAAW